MATAGKPFRGGEQASTTASKRPTSAGTGKKLLSLAELAQGVKEVATLAKKDGIKIALLGGYSLQLRGSPRLTGDLDFVAERFIRSLPHGPALSFGGEQTLTPSGVPVDIILRSDDHAALYEDALATSVRQTGVPVPLVRPEYMVAIKMVAGRTTDDADLEWLFAHSGIVDLVKARKVVKKFLGIYAAEEMDRLVEEVVWKKSKGRL